MKKTLLLLCALLSLCVSGVWATESTITVCTNSDAWSDHGSFTSQTSANWGTTWLSTDGYVTITMSKNSGYIYKGGTPNKMATTTYILQGLKGKLITGYSVSFYSNTSGSNSRFTAADGTYAETSSSSSADAVTLSATNLNGGTTIVVTGAYGCIKEFTITIDDITATKVTATSSLNTAKSYNIINPRGWWDVASGATVVNSTYELSDGPNTQSTGQQFAFIYDSEVNVYYLYSVSESKFVYVDDTKLSLTSDVTANVIASPVTFQNSTYSSTSAYNPTVVTIGGKIFGVSTGHSPDVYYFNSTSDEGNGSAVIEAADFDATAANAALASYYDTTSDITFNVIYEASGSVVATATETQTKGESLSLPTSLARGYCSYTFYSDAACTTPITTVPSDDATVYVLTTYTLPFTVSTDFASATWYYAYERTSTQLYYSATSGITTGSNAETDGEKWAFIGDPYNGIKVINGAAGDGKYLTHSTTALSWSTTATDWSIMAHPQYTSDGFVLFDVVSSNTYSIYLGSGGAVTALKAAITSSNDNVKGGCIELTAVPDDYKTRVASEITPYFSTLDVYYGMTTASANSLKSTYAYWDGQTSCTETEFNTLYDAVMAAIVYPEANKYYRIKNYSTNRYMGNEGSVATFTSGTTASTIIYLTEAESVKTINIQGAEAYSSTTFTLGAPGLFTIFYDNGGSAVYSYLRDNGGTISSWNVTSTTDTPQAYWTIEDAETFSGTLTNANDNTGAGHSYATLCVPFAISGLAGASAYAPTKDGNYLVMGDALATPIAAGTPVMLVGATDAGTYTANIKTDTAPVASPATTNALTGVFTGASIDCSSTSDNYVLGFDATNSNRIGFYHVTGDDDFALKANRAYLNTSGSNVKGFAISWDEIVDGIEQVQSSKFNVQSSTIYNLAGQRISKLQKGINIVNGKKVLVK